MEKEELIMLKLIILQLKGNILEMTLLVEGDENKAYNMSVDITAENLTTVSSDVPKEYRMYERQAKTALRKYKGKELPKVITSMWY